jgi:hypothetical protein
VAEEIPGPVAVTWAGQRANRDAEQAARHGEAIDPEHGESAYRERQPDDA